jgi:tetraacyldisaccharide 4'-kinase
MRAGLAKPAKSLKQLYLAMLDESREDSVARAVRTGLDAASGAYRAAYAVTRGLYTAGWLRAERLSIPVISVGNITWGGTGKTPLVIELAKRVELLGKRPLVLSRGYGADEWREIAENLPGAVVGVGPNRARVARERLSRARFDVAILDDGFQHWPLRRDWDIVALNARSPFGNGRLVPRGELREEPAALRRAHTIVLTHADEIDASELDPLKRNLARLAPEADLAEAVHEPAYFFKPSSGTVRPVEAFRGMRAAAVSGIGCPDSFHSLLRLSGIDLVHGFAFPDHHRFSERDFNAVREVLRNENAREVIITEKDFFRCPDLWARSFDPWILRIRIRFRAGEMKLWETLEALTAPGPGEKVYA